uniref:Transmembrane channel-like protein n=1 Tax=Oncorhynchus tshawytscha TaxID=74940 RepID=A0AAZ3RKJ0_ONCTS
MFYGYYTNSTINTSCRPDEITAGTGCGTTSDPHMMAYNIPLAYCFTIGITFFITGIVLVYSMSKSFGRSFRVFKSQGNMAIKVFCSWDFKVSKKMSVRMQSENITTQLKELLSEVKGGEEEKGRLSGMAVHLLAWSISLGSTFFCALGIHCFAKYMHLVSVCVCGGGVSHHRTTLTLRHLILYILFLYRNLLLKVSILGVLCYHWLGKIAAEPEQHGLQCWESFVGQELYRFLLVDFIFTVLYTVFGEFIWKRFSQGVLRRRRKPVFDIARNVLELIYGQTLTCAGRQPSSLLVNSLVAFLPPQSSLLVNCQASRKLWRASQMSTLFISLLCFPSFLGAIVSVTYTILTIKPSSGCGPFRNLPFMFHSAKQWAQELKSTNHKLAWLNWVHRCLVENPLFLFLLAGVFL